MGASSKDGTLPKSLTAKLTKEEIDAFHMWTYKQIGIFPNQYHHTYQEGSTMIYPEHIQDLLVIDKMVSNKFKFDADKQRTEDEHKQQQKALGVGQHGSRPSSNRMKGRGPFYGNTIKFNK